MEYNTKRDVAPGVPRIIEEGLQGTQPLDFRQRSDFRERALQISNLENRAFFDKILCKRRYNLLRNASKLDLSNTKAIADRGFKEYCVEGAIAQDVLSYAGFRGADLSINSGLPLLTDELANDYILLYEDRQESECGRGICPIVERVDPLLIEKQYMKARQFVKILAPEKRLFTSPEEVSVFLVRMGIEGVKMTYIILAEQNLINSYFKQT